MASASFQKPIEDIVECPICMETLKNTRVLPCIHTFCLQCIKKHGKGKKPGDTAQCPYCRKDFLVPIGGFDKLPKNTFIEKLLDVQCTLTTEWSNSCTVCTFQGHGKKSKSQSLAIWHCVECKQQMCGGCRSVHLRPGGTSCHHVLPVQKESPCREHPYKQLDRFCKICKTPVCGDCCASNHNGHDWSTLVNYVGAQQVEMEKLKLNNTEPGSQPNRQESELPLSSDAMFHVIQNHLIVLHMAANVNKFKSLLDEEKNKVSALAVVGVLLVFFLCQSRASMDEERTKWSSEKYNFTQWEEILKRQIQNLTVQLDEEKASCVSEKRNYAVMVEELRRQLHDLSDDMVLTKTVRPGPAGKT